MANLTSRYPFLAPLQRGFNEFWRWWVEELTGMLPASVRSAVLPRVERLYLQVEGAEVIASRGTSESIEAIGRYPLTQESLPADQALELEELGRRSREVVLCLPREKALVRRMTLPQVAEENLREVLGFEMDRQTPFSLDQVYYDCSITARDPRAGKLSLDLVVTPRAYLDELLTRLDDIGFRPHQATLCGQRAGQVQPVNLLPETARPRRSNTARYMNLALGVVVLALLLGAIVLPLMNKTQVISLLEARAEMVTGKAEVTRRLREEVEQLGKDARFLVDKKQGSRLTLEIIDELTRLLPDDTWITQLEIKGQQVQIQGESASAAALIPLIASSDMLANPQFRSPVTRLPRSNTERFNLSAELAQ